MNQHHYTTQEIKDMLAELAASQNQTSEQMKALQKSQNQTDEQMKKTDEKLEKMFAETSEQMEKTDAKLSKMFAETGAQMKKTDEKLERMGIYLAGIGHNNGDVAEEFFYSSLSKRPRLSNLKFDDVTKDMTKRRGNLQEQYDIVLTNGNTLAVIEVKYKVHPDDIKKLEQKVRNFKELFPLYKDFAVYGAMAGMSIPEDAEREALQKGFFVLKAQGDHIEVESGILKTV